MKYIERLLNNFGLERKEVILNPNVNRMTIMAKLEQTVRKNKQSIPTVNQFYYWSKKANMPVHKFKNLWFNN